MFDQRSCHLAKQDSGVGSFIYDGGGIYGAYSGGAGGSDAADGLRGARPTGTATYSHTRRQKACQLFADHAGNFNRTKHIDVLYHFMRERIPKGNVRVDYVPTDENEADIFLHEGTGTGTLLQV